MDTERERKQRGAANKGPTAQPLSAANRAILMMTLAIDVVAVTIYAAFGTGDQVTCGSGISAQVCYLPGVDWLGYVLLIAWVVTFFCFMLLKPDSK